MAALITIELAANRLKRAGFSCTVKDDRLVVIKDGKQVGTTLITDNVVSEHGIGRVTGGAA